MSDSEIEPIQNPTTQPVPEPVILLASRSPRRHSLLTDAGFRVQQITPPFNDPPQPQNNGSVSPQTLAINLARQKLESVMSDPPAPFPPRCVLISADTVVVNPDGSLSGQPEDPDDARRMINLMIDSTHQVVTGVALTDTEGSQHAPQSDHPSDHKIHTFSDTTDVSIGPVDPTAIETYVDSGRWQGKAGGYNLFDVQDHWPITVHGDPTTVVGLPMIKLLTLFRSHYPHLSVPSDHPRVDP